LAKKIELARELYEYVQGDPRFEKHAWKLWQGLCALVPDTELPKTLGVEKGSAFDNLVGVGLVGIFQNHFKRPAASRKDAYGAGIKGAFIDFAEAH
jgi:hypothetical protein